MSYRHLPTLIAMRCFEATSRHSSFTRAAAELKITQSAVSKQVLQLEAILEKSLFRRVGRTLKMTPEGEIYLSEVKKILAHVEQSTYGIQSYSGSNKILNITAPPTFAARWLMMRLEGFTACYPDIHLDISMRLDPFNLDDEHVDVAFFYGHGAWPSAECRFLCSETMIPICSPRRYRQDTPANARSLTSIGLLQAAFRPNLWQEWFTSQNLSIRQSYLGPRLGTFDMLISAAKAGCGVALVPEFMVAEEVLSGELSVAWDHRLLSRDAYYIAYSGHKSEDFKIKSFVDWIHDKA
ncbi:LysR substrate-binding domain-containing protein [Salinicola sp. LHM]|uniref:LysR substrate-binding domain-containing protein n=1 Tax=Salinicola sp. LHM TaxID=3065298 RepID=UPI002ACE5722|nr:LysR substrate-binding domain-containing protein [Salinicola sp. LHM]WQH33689.1 LysR substrate-binding domain-containing protein [Salinicola sp. LHM]